MHSDLAPPTKNSPKVVPCVVNRVALCTEYCMLLMQLMLRVGIFNLTLWMLHMKWHQDSSLHTWEDLTPWNDVKLCTGEVPSSLELLPGWSSARSGSYSAHDETILAQAGASIHSRVLWITEAFFSQDWLVLSMLVLTLPTLRLFAHSGASSNSETSCDQTKTSFCPCWSFLYPSWGFCPFWSLSYPSFSQDDASPAQV